MEGGVPGAAVLHHRAAHPDGKIPDGKIIRTDPGKL